jgi:cell division protein FtsW (lipid II flippase)
MGSGEESGLRWRALGCAVAAAGAGCVLLVGLGAPPRMIALNGAAIMIGLAGVLLVQFCQRAGAAPRWGDGALLAAAALVPLTAIAGPEANGVARWLVIGGLTIQPAMIAVPMIAMGVALRPTLIRHAAALLAALGLAMQPDPGCAAMLLFGLGAPLALHDGRRPVDLVAPGAAAIALAVALLRTVALPPVPFVEHVIQDAFGAGPLVALLALAAVILMVAPAMARPVRRLQLAFVGVWLAAIAAALFGPYPTPVLGFGGSAVLGYILSAGLLAAGQRPLPRRQRSLG